MNLATDNRHVESGEVWSTGGEGARTTSPSVFRIFFHIFTLFSALHGMPARTSDEKGVCQTRGL